RRWARGWRAIGRIEGSVADRDRLPVLAVVHRADPAEPIVVGDAARRALDDEIRFIDVLRKCPPRAPKGDQHNYQEVGAPTATGGNNYRDVVASAPLRPMWSMRRRPRVRLVTRAAKQCSPIITRCLPTSGNASWARPPRPCSPPFSPHALTRTPTSRLRRRP